MIIKANAYSLSPSRVTVGTAGSYGIPILEFQFSEEWASLTKKASFYFADGSSLVVLISNGRSCTVPSEIMENPGEYPFVLSGVDGTDMLISVKGFVRVLPTLKPSVTPPGSPTQSEISQIYDMMNTALSACSAAPVYQSFFGPAEIPVMYGISVPVTTPLGLCAGVCYRVSHGFATQRVVSGAAFASGDDVVLDLSGIEIIDSGESWYFVLDDRTVSTSGYGIGIESADFVLARATDNTLGGIRAPNKTPSDTLPIKIDTEGRLWSGGLPGVPELPQDNSPTASDYVVTYDPAALEHRKTLLADIRSLFRHFFDGIYSALTHNHRQSDVVGLTAALDGKISEPASDGTDGQVLTTDGAGNRSWCDAQPYVLPKAATSSLGGVLASAKTTTDTNEVRADDNGRLWTSGMPGAPEMPLETVPAASEYAVLYDPDDLAHKKALLSDIRALYKEYFDTLYPAIAHTHTQSDIDGLSASLGAKISEPASDGTDGQVLTTDGAGNRSWQDCTYTLPTATSTLLGGVRAAEKGASDTAEVKISADGRLWCTPTDTSSKQDKAIGYTVTIALSDWNGTTSCTKSAPQVTSESIVICDSSDPAVSCTAQSNGYLTFTAASLPSAATTVKAVIL